MALYRLRWLVSRPQGARIKPWAPAHGIWSKLDTAPQGRKNDASIVHLNLGAHYVRDLH